MKQDKWPYALLINDIHASKDNTPEFQKNWDEALAICSERGITEIVIGGDLWQSRSAQTLPVLMAVQQAILKATTNGIEVVIAPGNHDKIDQESILSYNHLFKAYDKVIVIDDYLIEDLDNDLMLVTMAYFPENGSFPDKLANLTAKENPANIILYIHEGINGALATTSDKELPANLFKDFKQVLVGHYHDRVKVGKNIQYIGASRQHNFGEDSEKGYTILYSDGSTEFVKNQANIAYATIDLIPENLEAGKKKVAELIKQGIKVKVRVSCESGEAKTIDKQALIDMGVTKVEIKSETVTVETAEQALETKYDKAGIKNEYTTFCEKKEISDVETGLKYLDKIQ